MISTLKQLCALVGTAAICCHGGNLLPVVISPPAPVLPWLGSHLAEQLASRTNGSFNFARKDGTGASQIYFYHGYPQLVTNFWLRDVTNYFSSSLGNIKGTNFGVGQCLTAITPRHCLTTTHTSGDLLNAPAVWLLADGSLYTNTPVAMTNYGTDTTVVMMAQTNPCWVKVLPDISRYVAFGNPAVPPPFVVRGHYASQLGPITTFVSGLSGMGNFGIQYLVGRVTFGDYVRGDSWQVGDSSSPAFCVINNEAVLVGLASSIEYAECPGLNLTTANHLLAVLSTNAAAPVYQITTADLTGFRTR
jgi:hypothetical protein